MRKLTYLLIAVVAFAMTSCGNAQDAKIAELEKEIAELKEKAATMDAAELEKAKTAVVEKMNTVVKSAKENEALKGAVEGFKSELNTIKVKPTAIPESALKGECGDCEKGHGECGDCEKGKGECGDCEKAKGECGDCDKAPQASKENCEKAAKSATVNKDLKVKANPTPVKGKIREAK